MSHLVAAHLAVWLMKDANVKFILELWISPQTVGERDRPLVIKRIWEWKSCPQLEEPINFLLVYCSTSALAGPPWLKKYIYNN